MKILRSTDMRAKEVAGSVESSQSTRNSIEPLNLGLKATRESQMLAKATQAKRVEAKNSLCGTQTVKTLGQRELLVFLFG